MRLLPLWLLLPIALALPDPQSGPPKGRLIALLIEEGEKSRPAVGATIRLLSEEKELPREDPAAETAGPDGTVVWPTSETEQRSVLVGGGEAAWTIVGSRLDVEAIRLGPGRSVSLQIVTPKGAPLRGEVLLPVASDRSLRFSGGKDGRLELDGLGAGEVTVTVRVADYLPLRLPLPHDSKRLVARPIPAARIAGRLVASDGAPVEGAVQLEGAVEGGRRLFREIPVGRDGRFRSNELPAGLYSLSFEAAGLASESLELALRAGETVTLPEVRLSEGNSITVQFYDEETGLPIPFPPVVRESNEPRGFALQDLKETRKIHTGSEKGLLRLRGLTAGLHRFALVHKDYARVALPPADLSGSAEHRDLGPLFVGRGTELEVLVRDREGGARQSVPVRLDRGPGLSPLYPLETKTDSEGIARFEHLGRGRYRLRAGPERQVLHQRWLDIGGRAKTEQYGIDLSGVDCRVELIGAGSPLARTSVWLAKPDIEPSGDMPISFRRGSEESRILNAPYNPLPRAVTDEEGTATLKDAEAGEARLFVGLPRSEWSTPVLVEPKAAEWRFELPLVPVAVSVLDAASGDRVHGASVQLETHQRIRCAGWSDPSGSAVLESVPGFPGKLTVTAPGFRTEEVPVGGTSDVPQVVRLTRTVPTSVRCRVRSRDGRLLSDALVDLRVQGREPFRRLVSTGADGIAELKVPEPGVARLIVRRPGFGSRSAGPMTLPEGLNDIGDMVLEEGFRLLISDERDGLPGGSVAIHLFDESGNDLTDGLDGESPRSLNRGETISIGPLGAGRYTLEVAGTPGIRKSVRVAKGDVQIVIE